MGIYFLRFIVGEDVEKTKEIMDRSNGKAPELLMSFQKQWKMVEASCESWNDVFLKKLRRIVRHGSEGVRIQRLNEEEHIIRWLRKTLRKLMVLTTGMTTSLITMNRRVNKLFC